MRIKYPKEIVDEFLGRRIRVVLSPDPSRIGIEGIVLNETKKMFFIKTPDGVKKIPKRDHVFDIYFDDWVRIEGNVIEFRPEERIRLVKKLRG